MMSLDKMKFVALMFAVFAVSCEGLFETSVDFEIPDQESVLATTAIFQSNFETSEILVSYTVDLNENNELKIVSNARIQLTTHNQTLENWTINNADRYLSSALDYEDLAGSTAEITVNAEGFETSSARIVVPDTPHIREVYFGIEKSFDIDGYKTDLLKVTIADQKEVKNFYGIEAFLVRSYQSGSNTLSDTSRFYLESDGLITEGGSPLIFSDASFDGKETVIRSNVFGSGVDENDQVIVRVTAFTEAFFQYLRSKSLYYDAEGNPFAEPVDLYSNMENGVGIFTINQVRDFPAEIDP